MSDNTRGMVEFDPLFDNLIGFFSPNLSPSIKSTWVERGGRIVNLQRLQSGIERIDYYFGNYYDQSEDILISRLQALKLEIHDQSFIMDSALAQRLMDESQYRYSNPDSISRHDEIMEETDESNDSAYFDSPKTMAIVEPSRIDSEPAQNQHINLTAEGSILSQVQSCPTNDLVRPISLDQLFELSSSSDFSFAQLQPNRTSAKSNLGILPRSSSSSTNNPHLTGIHQDSTIEVIRSESVSSNSTEFTPEFITMRQLRKVRFAELDEYIIPPFIPASPTLPLPTSHKIDVVEFFEILPSILLVVALSLGEALLDQESSEDENAGTEAMIIRRRERLRSGMKHLKPGRDGFEAISRHQSI